MERKPTRRGFASTGKSLAVYRRNQVEIVFADAFGLSRQRPGRLDVGASIPTFGQNALASALEQSGAVAAGCAC